MLAEYKVQESPSISPANPVSAYSDNISIDLLVLGVLVLYFINKNHKIEPGNKIFALLH